MNIADDILIFAKNQNEHDEIFKTVLLKCEDQVITLNLEKSVFCKSNLRYYGFNFSENGMQPDPKKVEEIKNTPQPESSNREFFVRLFISSNVLLFRMLTDAPVSTKTATD